MSRKKWIVSGCDKDRAAEIAENCGIEPFAAYILCARGLQSEEAIDAFLQDAELCDPFSLPDMEEACRRIDIALENGERITVFGDYDADGVTSTALLYTYLSKLGANVDYYIPDRASEGYGMNLAAIDEIKSRGTALIITVDNGISAVEEIAYAKKLGIDTVVTDHHKAGDVLPDAAAVVDPHIKGAECEFQEWAGVGVAFKLVSALEGDEGYSLLNEYADLVALGTVADIVPLNGENRTLVKAGVNLMSYQSKKQTLRLGIKILAERAGIKERQPISAGDAAYKLAPRINAAGRMGSAQRALKLLLTDDEREACCLAEEINSENSMRRRIEEEMTREAFAKIRKNPKNECARVIVVDGEGWHRGVIGIVASRIVEKYGKPVIVISRDSGEAKGSGRSVEGFSLYDALSYCSDILTQFGGHTLAAGLSLNSDDIEAFAKKINEYAKEHPVPPQTLKLACKLNPKSVGRGLLPSIALLEPFGAENPAPLFGLFNMQITSITPVGSTPSLKLLLTKGGISVNAMIFSKDPTLFPYSIGDTIDVAVKLSENEYMGTKTITVQVKDMRLSSSNDDKVLAGIALFEAFKRGEELTKEEKKLLLPDREFCKAVYKYIKAHRGHCFDCEVVCSRLSYSSEKVAQCLAAVDALLEVGVIKSDGREGYDLTTVAKADLYSASVFKKLSPASV